MGIKNYYLILCTISLIACNNSTTQTNEIDTTTKTIKLTDSSKEKLVNALGDIIKSNSTPGDTTISGRYISQGKYNNGDFYITVKTDDSTINLINLSLLKEDEISKLKKAGNNLTLTYNPSDMTVKFLSVNFEPEK